ncbi:tol-pal system protein YbgF [Reinekea marinisedimentorum]|uniref:tol-pal system protein YbgF n=1 Tax=Reinekea marinisedimentorum TaxID=230495 RepID=UPI001404BFF6|nr:tol-pal system protein YbgF [Reinekea marinisedimentorum]
MICSLFASAEVPVVQSQADHVATSSSAVPLNRTQNTNGPSTELIETLMFQVQQLESTVAEQRGLIEELSYQVQVLQQEQKERYIDLDNRIQSIQQQAVTTAATTQAVPVTDDAQTALTDEEILAQYNAATALMQERKFDESIARLSEFAQQHPDHPLTPNAWYWTGEIYLVQRQVESARTSFEKVVADYPDHAKVSDSLYKLGVIAQQGSKPELAKTYFERVIKDYPSTQSAKLSEARLNSN